MRLELGLRRCGAASLLAAAALLTSGTGAAQAATFQSSCESIQADLNSASPGDTLVLTGLCDGLSLTLPNTPGLTIEGAATGTNGFDGQNGDSPASAPALSQAYNSDDGLTVENLTFENYTSSAAVSINQEVATSGVTVTEPFVFSGDTFSGNTAQGGLSLAIGDQSDVNCAAAGPLLTISGSTFTGNATSATGGGAAVDVECDSQPAALSVTDNTFTGNIASGINTHNPNDQNLAGGGGLAVQYGDSAYPLLLAQSGNVFSGNDVTQTGGMGGGEMLVGVNLTSTDDEFIDNTLAGANGWMWTGGGGIAMLGAGSCENQGAPGPVSVLNQDVITGNSIGDPTGPNPDFGGGVYAGCEIGYNSGNPATAYNLTVNDSTISGNSVSDTEAIETPTIRRPESPSIAVTDGTVASDGAGLDGESGDIVNLNNTIVYGDTGGNEIGGFGATDGANATVQYSDVCSAAGSTTPFTGTANICANPTLSNVATGDVHETAGSPTVDAGSNALVPNTLTSDFYAVPRIVAGQIGGYPPVVDIGAAELQQPAPVNLTPPVITGTLTVGQKLSAGNGTWTGTPTGYTYQWEDCNSSGAACGAVQPGARRANTPIAGATASTYTVTSADVGDELRVVVTAKYPNPADLPTGTSLATSVVPPVVTVVKTPTPTTTTTTPTPTVTPGCPPATGAVTGSELGELKLGMSRAAALAVFHRVANRGGADIDVLCLNPTGIRIFSKGGKVVMITTSNRHYRVAGYTSGGSLSALRSKVRLGSPFHVGVNTWYLAAGAGSTLVVKVQGGTVGEIGIATLSLTKTRAEQGKFIRSFD